MPAALARIEIIKPVVGRLYKVALAEFRDGGIFHEIVLSLCADWQGLTVHARGQQRGRNARHSETRDDRPSHVLHGVALRRWQRRRGGKKGRKKRCIPVG